MRKLSRYSGAAVVATAIAITPALARDGVSSMFRGPMMGPGVTINMTGTMDAMEHMGGMMGQMGGMMDQCRQMMQDHQDSSGKPNDQWRQDPAAPSGKPKTPEKQQ